MSDTLSKTEQLETELSALKAEFVRREKSLENELNELYDMLAIENTPDISPGQRRLVTSHHSHHFDDHRELTPFIITVVRPFYHIVGKIKTLYVKIEYPNGETNNKPYEVIKKLSVWDVD